MDRSPPVSVPRLRTQRLTLREYRAEDFDAFAAHCADPVSTAFIGPADRHTAWRIFGCQAGAWLLHGIGWWTVERHETQEVVGSVGAFIREGHAGIEVGWNTYRAFWGHGFASEAGAEAVRFAFEVRGEPRVKAFIDPRNAPSIRVASHLGLRHEADTDLYGKAVGLYTRERDARVDAPAPRAPALPRIRAARDSDAGGLMRLIAAVYAEYPGCVLDVDREEPDLRAISSAYTAKGGQFWVAVDGADEAIVGCVGWSPSRDSARPGWVELRKLYVARSHRRRGLASALSDHVESAARDRRAPGIELWSDTRFKDAHVFYAQRGYERQSAVRQLADLSQSSEYQFLRRLAG